MGKKLILAASLLILLLVSGSCASAQSFDSQLASITAPYTFSIAGWEFSAVTAAIKQPFVGEPTQNGNAQTVVQYFSLAIKASSLKAEIEAVRDGAKKGDIAYLEAELSRTDAQQKALVGTVQETLAGQIKKTLTENGIYNPLDNPGIKVSFPPVNFRLESPLYVLIVSPRDRIDNIEETTITQDISLEEMEAVEAEVDALGVSSLVVETGGFGGTYPTFVANNASLRFTIETAIHEWLHQYLAFKPLGFRYVLDLIGVSKDYDIRTMNETVASMVGKELAALVYQKYYPQLRSVETPLTGPAFDFNREMRDIRKSVDGLLARGEIEQAEKFMEQKRQYLADNGYYIRKLNQAYFAFYGCYADSPTSVSPIGVEMKELRNQSVSLKAFLDTAAAMTSRQDLSSAVK